jgi:hypothetical protein
MRFFAGLNGPCFLKKCLEHRVLKWLTWFMSRTTQGYSIQCSQCGAYTLSHSLVILFLLVAPAPSELGFYIRSDDVLLPEPSVSRSFSHFPRYFKGRECSGSFFTWLVGWGTDTLCRLW